MFIQNLYTIAYKKKFLGNAENRYYSLFYVVSTFNAVHIFCDSIVYILIKYIIMT
jgi:hypothetical protein